MASTLLAESNGAEGKRTGASNHDAKWSTASLTGDLLGTSCLFIFLCFDFRLHFVRVLLGYLDGNCGSTFK